MVIHQFSTSTSGAHNTVFTGTNAAVFIAFFVLRLRHLFEGGVYCKIYSNTPGALIKELPRRKRRQQTIREGHWEKEERSWTIAISN